MKLEIYSTSDDELIDTFDVEEVHVYHDEIIYLPCNTENDDESFESYYLSYDTHYKIKEA